MESMEQLHRRLNDGPVLSNNSMGPRRSQWHTRPTRPSAVQPTPPPSSLAPPPAGASAPPSTTCAAYSHPANVLRSTTPTSPSTPAPSAASRRAPSDPFRCLLAQLLGGRFLGQFFRECRRHGYDWRRLFAAGSDKRRREGEMNRREMGK
jgi:hypothetical protein